MNLLLICIAVYYTKQELQKIKQAYHTVQLSSQFWENQSNGGRTPSAGWRQVDQGGSARNRWRVIM
jgi:hypothetical protein